VVVKGEGDGEDQAHEHVQDAQNSGQSTVKWDFQALQGNKCILMGLRR
jgi:hypothetical protein